jgi:hypothetical protein
MTGRLIDGVRYIYLNDANELKNKSLEDNIYYTLRDIFWNSRPDYCFEANNFNSILTNNIFLENRENNFEYPNILYDYNSNFTQNLYDWLYKINKDIDNVFYFIDPNENKEFDINEYMKFDDWWAQFKDLIQKIEQQLEMHKIWQAEDVCNRQAELSDNEDF